MIAIRSEREIGILREANQIVAQVHARLARMVAPGVTTAELNAVAEEYIHDCGAVPAFKGYRGYPAATCISIDDVVVHGIPGKRKLRRGQIVSIDVGVEYRGYFGDAAVSIPCGRLDKDKRRLLATTDLALVHAISAARVGNYLVDIGRAVETVCRKDGFSVVRDFVGHGIGTQMHEEPQVPNFDTGKRGPRLKAGMVLAIEPMVTAGTYEVR